MDFATAMERIQAITGTRTQVELANVLGIRQSSISDAKRRQTIPDSWLQTLIWHFDANPRFILGQSSRPYLCEDNSRELLAAVPQVATSKAEPEPTLDDILETAKAMAGPGYEFVLVPRGAKVNVELPQPVYTMDDLEFAQKPVLALPGQVVA